MVRPIQLEMRIIFFLFSLILLVFAVDAVSAAGCSIVDRNLCPSGNVALGLSGDGNAHAELYNESNYDEVLCCFPIANATCTGSNKLLGLSGNTNAHAEAPEESNYGIDVCFEGLECTSGLTSCGGSYPSEVLSLSGQTNAHVGAFEDYPTKVCCNFTLSGLGIDPVAIISSPKNGGIYYKDVLLNFTHSSFDLDDGITNVSWDLGDGTVREEDSFLYAYSAPGQKVITLTVTDGSGETAEDQIAILILASPGIYTFISEPMHREVIVTDTLEVSYDGSDGYVVDSTINPGSPCTVNVECLAGSCPLQTEGGPSCTADPSDPIVVNDPYGARGDVSNLYYTWMFKIDGEDFNTAGWGDVESSGTHHYAKEGEKNLTLIVNYTNSTFGIDIWESFVREFELLDTRLCRADGTVWYDSSSGQEHDTLNTGFCDGTDNIIGSSDDCCPLGHACTEDGCVLDERVPLKCSDYDFFSNYSNLIEDSSITNESLACDADPFNAVESDALFVPLECGSINERGDIVQCQCLWFNGGCELNATYIDTPGFPEVEDRSCVYNSSLGACFEGFQQLRVTLLEGDVDECTDIGEYVVPCGKPSVSLPFFGFMQFGITLMACILIYLIFLRKVRIRIE